MNQRRRKLSTSRCRHRTLHPLFKDGKRINYQVDLRIPCWAYEDAKALQASNPWMTIKCALREIHLKDRIDTQQEGN